MFFSQISQRIVRKTILIIIVFFISACGSGLTPEPTIDVGAIYTQVMGTTLADFSIKATQTALALPTQTPIPTATNTLIPTNTLVPTNTPVWAGVNDAICLPTNEVKTAKVVEIVDGDTIKVLLEDKVYSVRYIGVDTPETNGGFYSAEAEQKNTELVYGKEVFLVKDVSETDVYGRLLRYVIADNKFVNHELVLNGFAQASSYPPDIACDDVFKLAETAAKTSAIGIWQAPTQAPIIYNTPVNNSAGNCSPAYPGVCIPPSPPDLDCGDISYRRFQVLPPDPHRFDGDGDGLGCEG